MTIPELKNLLKISDTELARDILDKSKIVTISEGETILSEGDCVRYVPLVLSGVNKVFTNRRSIDICKNCTEGTKVWS